MHSHQHQGKNSVKSPLSYVFIDIIFSDTNFSEFLPRQAQESRLAQIPLSSLLYFLFYFFNFFAGKVKCVDLPNSLSHLFLDPATLRSGRKVYAHGSLFVVAETVTEDAVTSAATPTNSGGGSGGGGGGDAGRSGEDGSTLDISRARSRQGRAEGGGGGDGVGGEGGGGGGKKGKDRDGSGERRNSGGGSFAEMTQDVFGQERPRAMPAMPAIPAMPAMPAMPAFAPWTSLGVAVDAPPVVGGALADVSLGDCCQVPGSKTPVPRDHLRADLQIEGGTGLVAWEGGELQRKVRDADLCKCLFGMRRDLAILAFLPRELAENDHVVL